MSASEEDTHSSAPHRKAFEPDIVIRTSGGALVGQVKTLRGKDSAQEVIGQLLHGMERPSS